jgi:CheY-like chemotaxis protein
MPQNGHVIDTPTILLIDDNVNFAATIAELLRHGGYATMTANSGEQGLTMLHDHADSTTMPIPLRWCFWISVCREEWTAWRRWRGLFMPTRDCR